MTTRPNAKAKQVQAFKPAIAKAYQSPEALTKAQLQDAVRQALANARAANGGARTFRGKNVAEALAAVQQELGPEALVVSVRQLPASPGWQMWRKPAVEVIAMPTVKPLAAPVTENEPVKAGGGAAPAAPVTLTRNAESVLPAALIEIQRTLTQQGVAVELIEKVSANCSATLSPRALEDKGRVREHIQRQLEACLRIWPSTALTSTAIPGRGPKVVCAVGASGCGKTTTLGKVAAFHVRHEALRVAWVCADTVRAGAIAQARFFAEAFKLPFRVAYTPDDLAKAVIAEKETDLIVVDTPGCNPQRKPEVIELMHLLSALPGRHTYLAAPATAKDADLTDALAAFGPLDLKGLVLTKLDETSTYGSAFNLAWRSRLPLMYFTTGPGTLDDLHSASTGMLVGGLMQ